MSPRDISSWKTYFYHGLLPTLRRTGPERADATLAAMARSSLKLMPGRRAAYAKALARARAALGPRAAWWDPEAVAPEVAAGLIRFHARDYLLDTPDDARALARFEVQGESALREALAMGRGLVLVGGHLGGHLAAFHWLYRRGVPLRVMVQRPRHVTRALDRFFDRADPDPQSGYFLSRSLGATDCVDRMLRVRAAVRSGKAVYFAGDVPWQGPNTREGRLLGETHPFLAVWADLSALTGAPVVFTFCTHRPGGRFALRFESLGRVQQGEEGQAVARFLLRLEDVIAADPGDAAAHLLWPCYGPAVAVAPGTPAGARRPSRRSALVEG